jgi:hypothetical protein
MKTIRKNKPDLLVVLAMFVGLGVLISTYTQGMSPAASVKSVTTDTKSSVTPSNADKKVYTGDYIKVTNQYNNPPLPKEQRR